MDEEHLCFRRPIQHVDPLRARYCSWSPNRMVRCFVVLQPPRKTEQMATNKTDMNKTRRGGFPITTTSVEAMSPVGHSHLDRPRFATRCCMRAGANDADSTVHVSFVSDRAARSVCGHHTSSLFSYLSRCHHRCHQRVQHCPCSHLTNSWLEEGDEDHNEI